MRRREFLALLATSVSARVLAQGAPVVVEPACGGKSLKVGQLVNLNADPTGMLCSSRSGGGVAGGWKLIASASDGRNSTSVYPIDTTGADLLVLFSAATAIPGVRVVSDSYNNTWIYEESGGNTVAFYYCRGGVVGPNHTFTITGGSYPAVAVTAFSGSATNPADQVAFNAAATGSVGPITPSVANALVITGESTNGTIAAPPAGFTMLAYSAVASNFGAGLAYQVQAVPIAVTAAWSTDTAPVGTGIMSFKPAASLKRASPVTAEPKR